MTAASAYDATCEQLADGWRLTAESRRQVGPLHPLQLVDSPHATGPERWHIPISISATGSLTVKAHKPDPQRHRRLFGQISTPRQKTSPACGCQHGTARQRQHCNGIDGIKQPWRGKGQHCRQRISQRRHGAALSPASLLLCDGSSIPGSTTFNTATAADISRSVNLDNRPMVAVWTPRMDCCNVSCRPATKSVVRWRPGSRLADEPTLLARRAQ